MTDPQSPRTRRAFEARIIAKAWKNPNYKQRLLSNPKAVQEIAAIDPSVSLPSALQVQVHEEAPDLYHLVLPRNPKDISLGELLGDNLDLAAPQTAAVAVVTAQGIVIAQVTNAQMNFVTIQTAIQNVIGIQNVVAVQVANNIASVNANVVANAVA